jgi:hypothetical protein
LVKVEVLVGTVFQVLSQNQQVMGESASLDVANTAEAVEEPAVDLRNEFEVVV